MVDFVNLVSALSACVAAGAALRGLRLSQELQTRADAEKRGDALLAQASTALEVAYESLTKDLENGAPAQSRLNWLTSARHLLRYRKLKSHLQGTQQLICNEREEAWRLRFYLILEPLEKRYGYFDPPEGDSDLQRTIVPKSAAVVIAFSQWPDSVKDPLNEFPIEQIVAERESFVFRFPAFERQYLAAKNAENERQA
ncbi:hypothetical protein [Bordetella genomosp. 4]|uniref:Uncharacterized protein n=1 Tax=Bordetella genomosp. 4 TaxID=463044 RepID=A0A261UUQ2_9BORD|nr:hypothetical protein [Bordetella genomosp. 4]OZI64633.1 hypothetical protein CAL20_02990 [Bordetella genomosp. 4]